MILPLVLLLHPRGARDSMHVEGPDVLPLEMRCFNGLDRWDFVSEQALCDLEGFGIQRLTSRPSSMQTSKVLLKQPWTSIGLASVAGTWRCLPASRFTSAVCFSAVLRISGNWSSMTLTGEDENEGLMYDFSD